MFLNRIKAKNSDFIVSAFAFFLLFSNSAFCSYVTVQGDSNAAIFTLAQVEGSGPIKIDLNGFEETNDDDNDDVVFTDAFSINSIFSAVKLNNRTLFNSDECHYAIDIPPKIATNFI